MEPTLQDIEDYNNHESLHKRRTVNLIVLLLFAGAIVYGLIKAYYDVHMPQSFTPVIEQQELEKFRSTH